MDARWLALVEFVVMATPSRFLVTVLSLAWAGCGGDAPSNGRDDGGSYQPTGDGDGDHGGTLPDAGFSPHDGGGDAAVDVPAQFPSAETTCSSRKLQCNGACLSDQGDRASGCTLLDTGLANSSPGLSYQSGKIYYGDDTHIRSWDTASQAIADVWSDANAVVGNLSASDSHIFFEDRQGIFRMPREGGAVERLAADERNPVFGFQVRPGELLYADEDTVMAIDTTTLQRSTLTWSMSSPIRSFVSDDQVLYVAAGAIYRYERHSGLQGTTHSDGAWGRLLFDEDYVYFLRTNGLKRMLKAGGAIEHVGVFPTGCQLFAMSNGFAYAKAENDSEDHTRIYRLPLASGSEALLVASFAAWNYDSSQWATPVADVIVVDNSLFVRGSNPSGTGGLVRVELPPTP